MRVEEKEAVGVVCEGVVAELEVLKRETLNNEVSKTNERVAGSISGLDIKKAGNYNAPKFQNLMATGGLIYQCDKCF